MAPPGLKHNTASGRRRAWLPLLIIAGLLASAGARAAESARSPAAIATTVPESKALPDARVHAALASYEQWLDVVAASNRVSGMATAVVIGDQVRFEHSFGYANTATREPIGPTTVFRVASLSKAFSTALAGLLVRHGVLSWDTPVASLLPFFKLATATATNNATIRDLLSHRVGLPHNTYDHKLEQDVPYEALVRELDQIDLICEVGDCYSYQNVAFSLLGDMVYARTGDFFNHQVAKRLFQPLAMDTATYGRAALEASASWARPHIRDRHGWVPLVPKPNYYRVPPAAGVNASVRDMEQWLIAQMGGRPDVLPAELLQVLHAPIVATPGQTRYSPWRRSRLNDADYALGWRIYDYAGHTLVFHAGAIEGYRAMIGFLPEYEVGMVMLWNCSCVMPAGLMPMLFDSLLGLPAVDWADVGDVPASRLARRPN